MESESQQWRDRTEAVEVDKALLSTHKNFLTRITIYSMRMLKQIAEEEQVAKIEDLTPQQMIGWFERDAKLKRLQGDTAGSLLQW